MDGKMRIRRLARSSRLFGVAALNSLVVIPKPVQDGAATGAQAAAPARDRRHRDEGGSTRRSTRLAQPCRSSSSSHELPLSLSAASLL
jgi:hypothetical protein